MESKGRQATIILVICNIFLFAIKITAGIMSNSLAIISDAFNSLTDIISSVIIFFAVKVSSKAADDGHPFGHHRAEPIAGLIVAIFAGILGFEILHTAVFKLLDSYAPKIGIPAMITLLVSIGMKLFMSGYLKKVSHKINSPALLASSIDSRNDVCISSAALLGIIGGLLGYVRIDGIAAIFISFWIIYSGYKIGVNNIDYLMGKQPEDSIMEEIKKKAAAVSGVIGIHDVRAHYVGHYIHVEIHISVDHALTLTQAHNLGKNVQRTVESIESIHKAFVHIDPI
ncbi:MAG: cation diffusion facilitator family transporter [Candidatus Brocadia sp.]|jgi:cation diffusion facilitator family transporter|uniref:Cobalt/zinc/cadmium cation efflux pump n=1 Tax=Candidatus Brocadia fulgida TaxID=380242 RepID=A0A0M2V0T0_9BACT|nr:MAG: putative cobalt/zinc/cadmium cation efflux pump [Candidatus Brocadia fulgida]MCC6324184.1 cation transporter [Candidatus Brocadia sp.]MDG5995983.1 cation transporter [Candidatus Brocadia sp.]UJS21596.1 MAG: cation diffusion facilitator family transporter [Candidatus Brocadia sp.]